MLPCRGEPRSLCHELNEVQYHSLVSTGWWSGPSSRTTERKCASCRVTVAHMALLSLDVYTLLILLVVWRGSACMPS